MKEITLDEVFQLWGLYSKATFKPITFGEAYDELRKNGWVILDELRQNGWVIL